MLSYKSIPVLINCRDQVSMLRQQVEWLLSAGHQNIYLIDNASTYTPLLEYLTSVRFDVTVVRLNENVGHLALWEWDLLNRLKIRPPFVYSDPDMVPIQECPQNLVEHLYDLLCSMPETRKVGCGIVYSDLPSCYTFRDQVVKWESQFWKVPVGRMAFRAAVDTTFAIYRDTGPFILEAIRTNYPYVMRHLPWYLDSADPSEEQIYYQTHCKSGCTSWSDKNLPLYLEVAIANLK